MATTTAEAALPAATRLRWWAWWLIAILVTILLVAVTKTTGFGETTWHYTATFAATTVAYAAAWRHLGRDRTTIGVPLLVMAVLTVATGFYLLYAKEWLKATGWKDVAKYWHSLVSWILILLTVGHFRVNWDVLVEYVGDIYRRAGAAVGFTVTWLAVAAAIVVPVQPSFKVLFTDGNYLWLSSLTIFAVTAVGYVTWIGWKVGSGQWSRRDAPRGGTPGGWTLGAIRRHLDAHMLGWYVLAQASGLVLLYFKDFLHGNGFKHVSKYWHTAPSAVVTIMIAAHTLLSLPLLAHYWGRWRRRLGGMP